MESLATPGESPDEKYSRHGRVPSAGAPARPDPPRPRDRLTDELPQPSKGPILRMIKYSVVPKLSSTGTVPGREDARSAFGSPWRIIVRYPNSAAVDLACSKSLLPMPRPIAPGSPTRCVSSTRSRSASRASRSSQGLRRKPPDPEAERCRNEDQLTCKAWFGRRAVTTRPAFIGEDLTSPELRDSDARRSRPGMFLRNPFQMTYIPRVAYTS